MWDSSRTINCLYVGSKGTDSLSPPVVDDGVNDRIVTLRTERRKRVTDLGLGSLVPIPAPAFLLLRLWARS